MKSLIISSSDLDGGAARAAYRLHQGLHSLGYDSFLLVRDKLGTYPNTIQHKSIVSKLATNLDSLPTKLYPRKRKSGFTPQWFPDDIISKLKSIKPDIVNLHWVGLGYVRIESLTLFKKPIFWTLHDMWAFTGGCHYTYECNHFEDRCGKCPQLGSNTILDLSRLIWHRKANAWKKIDLTIVTPSHWLASEAKKSSLFRSLPIKVIPNGVDTNQYSPIEQSLARQILGLPKDKKIILFGANGISDERKGFEYLCQALKLLDVENRDQIELVVFGSAVTSDLEDIGFKLNFLGRFNDDISLAILYSSADVFVVPSIQENFPNTILEALACGTPCVAFDIGGIPEMIVHKQNGYLAKRFDSRDLAEGISWVLHQVSQNFLLRTNARFWVEKNFTNLLQAERYESLFQEKLYGYSTSTELQS